MSRPMTAQQIVAQLSKWGVPFKPVAGWETRNRNSVGTFNDVRGFMVHHTGDDAPDSNDLRLIRDGRSDLPGPLAQFGCDDAGTIWLVGCGRANHAGGGDPVVLAAVTNDSYNLAPPKTTKHQGSPGAVDGNSHFYGVETFYSGAKPPTSRAYASLVLLAAAICDFHDWSSKSVIGHREWSDWKIDPGGVSMSAFRADVELALRRRADAEDAEQLDAGEPTRVTRARRHMRRAMLLLEEAVTVGERTGIVRDVAVELRALLRRLPTR